MIFILFGLINYMMLNHIIGTKSDTIIVNGVTWEFKDVRYNDVIWHTTPISSWMMWIQYRIMGYKEMSFAPGCSNSVITIGRKIAQQVDSAEASTIAVPPSEPPGSPR